VSGTDELKHIVQTFLDRGVKVTLNTDGPYLLETDMQSEVALVERHGIMTPDQVDQALGWAREYSFIP
jgi:adenosine deaminase